MQTVSGDQISVEVINGKFYIECGADGDSVMVVLSAEESLELSEALTREIKKVIYEGS